VDQCEYNGIAGELREVCDGLLVIPQFLIIGFILLLHIKDVDQYLYVLEDGFTLSSEVLLHQTILAPTIPEIQGQIPHEPELILIDVHRVPNTHGLAWWVIGKNDGVHGSFACLLAAHEQHFL
jgi:hypothetical protein